MPTTINSKATRTGDIDALGREWVRLDFTFDDGTFAMSLVRVGKDVVVDDVLSAQVRAADSAFAEQAAAIKQLEKEEFLKVADKVDVTDPAVSAKLDQLTAKKPK